MIHRSASTTRNVLASLFLLMTAAAGCTSNGGVHTSALALVAPPLPKPIANEENLQGYYPDASKRAKEIGRVVVELKISPSGALDGPPLVDASQTSAAPRLIDATMNMLDQKWIIFDVGGMYKRIVRASVVFELQPCGAITHAKGSDYRFNLCATPRQIPTRDVPLQQVQEPPDLGIEGINDPGLPANPNMSVWVSMRGRYAKYVIANLKAAAGNHGMGCQDPRSTTVAEPRSGV
jgi:Gram-negative bacterial TonB protein C-terminal